MDAGEILELTEGGVVDIGAHTMTHTCLSALPPGAQTSEIESSRQVLEKLVGRPVRSFAYPYGGRGDIGVETPGLVEAAGFEIACTTSSGFVTRSADRFRLPRLVVRDWDGRTFEREVETVIRGQ